VSPKSFTPFGGGVSATIVHPAAAVAIALAAILVLLLPRKLLVVPVLLATLLVPMGNVLVVAGFHFPIDRVIILFGLTRLSWIKLTSGTEILGSRWNKVDTAFLCWGIFQSLDFILLWRQMPAVTNRFGFLLSTVGAYFILRFLIQDEDDIERTVKLFAVVVVVNAAEMAYERFTGSNLFALLLGGVRQFPEVRDGAIRSQGAFGHPILAGTFAATLIPLFFWLWKSGRAKGTAAVGLILASSMVLMSGSSTPLFAYVAVVGAMCFWPLRGSMRLVRWGIVLCFIGLQLVMKAPIWFLVAHLHVINGSTGYDRSVLIDTFVRKFGDWWLLGTKSTATWGWSMSDLTNQYVEVGERGGLAALIFFILAIKRAFGVLGKARRAAEGDRREEWLLWSLGSALFTYLVAFIGVTLWDQTQLAWVTLFAMICAATSSRVAKEGACAQVSSPNLDASTNSVEGARPGYAWGAAARGAT